MTVLSAILCKAYIGKRGVLAIALGFAGVLVLLRPGPDALSPVMVLPLLAGFFTRLQPSSPMADAGMCCRCRWR